MYVQLVCTGDCSNKAHAQNISSLSALLTVVSHVANSVYNESRAAVCWKLWKAFAQSLPRKDCVPSHKDRICGREVSNSVTLV